MTISVIISLADGFEEIEAITPIDVLRRAGFDVVSVGMAGKTTATGSHGVVFQVDKPWDAVASETPDLLVLPGGMPGSKNLGEHDGLRAMAKRVADSGGTLAAICAAPAFTLGSWGLLSGKSATCYPGCESTCSDPVAWRPDGVVVDGKTITAKGPGKALDFALTIVAQLSGPDAAAMLKDQMQY